MDFKRFAIHEFRAMNKIEILLNEVETLVERGVGKEETIRLIEILNCSFPIEILDEIKLYGDYLPMNNEIEFSDEKRYLHFIWDLLDKSPMCLIGNFAIPFRRILAKRLFKSCGKNFIAEENVRFNVPDNIEIGDDVFLNRGVFIDSKGGVTLGKSCALTEGVTIFTHSHSEHDHTERSYSPVVLEDYAKVYSNSTILPGVTIRKQGLVAACSLVTADVEENSMVAGSPAKVVRDRRNLENIGDKLNHIWLHEGEYQEN